MKWASCNLDTSGSLLSGGGMLTSPNLLRVYVLISMICTLVFFLRELVPKTVKLALESLHGLGRVGQGQVLLVVETSSLSPVIRSIDDKGIIDHCELVVHKRGAMMTRGSEREVKGRRSVNFSESGQSMQSIALYPMQKPKKGFDPPHAHNERLNKERKFFRGLLKASSLPLVTAGRDIVVISKAIHIRSKIAGLFHGQKAKQVRTRLLACIFHQCQCRLGIPSRCRK